MREEGEEAGGYRERRKYEVGGNGGATSGENDVYKTARATK